MKTRWRSLLAVLIALGGIALLPPVQVVGQNFSAQITVALRRLLATSQTVTGVWTFSTPPVGGGAPTDATYLTQTANSSLSAEFAIGADPNADRIVFWDDSAGNFQYLTVAGSASISGTTLTVTGFDTSACTNGRVLYKSAGDPCSADFIFLTGGGNPELRLGSTENSTTLISTNALGAQLQIQASTGDATHVGGELSVLSGAGAGGNDGGDATYGSSVASGGGQSGNVTVSSGDSADDSGDVDVRSGTAGGTRGHAYLTGRVARLQGFTSAQLYGGASTLELNNSGIFPSGLFGDNIVFDNSLGVLTDTTTAHTALLRAYDNDTGPDYVTCATLLNGNSPSFTISNAGGCAITLTPTTLTIPSGTSYTGGTVTAKFVSNGTSPAVDDTSGGNSCGAAGNPSMAANSTDNAGGFSVGAGGGTDCTVTFTVAAPHFWNCSPSDATSAVLVRSVPVNTTTTKFQGVLGAADAIAYLCTAY